MRIRCVYIVSHQCSMRKQPTFHDATTGFPVKWSVSRGRSRGRVQGVGTLPSNTTCILQIKKTLWCIGVEVKHETRLKN